jgi:hypothetical protein
VDETDVGPDEADATVALLDRMAALERRVTELRAEVRTRRFAVVDERDDERLVAELVGPVLELRAELPGSPSGQRTALLLFAAAGEGDLSPGVGLQIWARGNLVDERCWWADAVTDPSM